MLKLGKKPAAPLTPETFRIGRLAAVAPLPDAPRRFGHGYIYKDWTMLGNGPDPSVRPGFGGAGCCVLSDAGHMTMLTNKLARHPVRITGKETIEDYSAVTGYVLGDDSTDYGTDMGEAFSYRRHTGIVDAGGNRHKIGAYVSINAGDWQELRKAVYAFTAVSIGFNFPASAWEQLDSGHAWDYDGTSDYEGGHDVPVVGFATDDRCGVVTWGKRQGMTRSFYEHHNDESWACVFVEELRNGKTWRGYPLDTLRAWLADLT